MSLLANGKRVLDLCCGMGGISYGFKEYGYEIDQGIDISKTALRTYSKYVKAPGTLIGIEEYYPTRKDFDMIIVGGTPCQDFSIANRNRNRYSKRSQLVIDYCRIVKAVQPDSFVFENVPHLSKWGAAALLEMPGYKVTETLVNTADYGVPQERKRKIFIGNKKKHITLTPPGIRTPTVRDAFNAIPENWGFVKHRAETIAKFKTMQSTKWANNTGTSAYQGTRRLVWNAPSCGIGNVKKFRLLHPRDHRSITLAEALALQGFPHWYIPCGTDTQKAQQIADTFPPLAAYHIAASVCQENN